LHIDAVLADFVAQQALPGTGLSATEFWAGVESILLAFTPRNQSLLAKRDTLQAQIDQWWYEHRQPPFDVTAHTEFLRRIGYLVDEPAAFHIETSHVDAEIATTAGPQLVVPVSNARYALNAANARWVSLYDALYGTDAIEPPVAGARGYDAARGARPFGAPRFPCRIERDRSVSDPTRKSLSTPRSIPRTDSSTTTSA
jgi:malate synthase